MRLFVIVRAIQKAIGPHFDLDENVEHIENFVGLNDENITAADNLVIGLDEEENRQTRGILVRIFVHLLYSVSSAP